MLCYRNTITCNSWEIIEPEYESNIKIEAIDIHEIKSEPINTSENIDHHTASNSNKSSHSKFNCNMCHQIFNNYEELVIHKYVSHKEKPYLCKICNTKFTLSAHLNIHLNEHVDYIYMKELSFQTDIQSPTQSHLKQDLNTLKSSIASTRNVCKEVLQEKLPVKNYYVSESTKLPLKRSKRKSFKCSDCKFVTMSEAKLLRHQNICNHIQTSSRPSNRLVRCKLCIRTFVSKTALNGHMRYHSLRGEIISKRKNAMNNKILNSQKQNNIMKSTINKPIYVKDSRFITNNLHKCNDCNKKFMTHNKLNIHQLQHKKHMMCNICNKQFFLKRSFEKHLLLHNHFDITNDQQDLAESMECNSMDTQMLNRYKEPNTNKKKQKLIITIKPYQCSFCKQFYSTEKSLGEHIRTFHMEMKPITRKFKLESVKCNWCNAVITKANLFRHIKSLHPEVSPVSCSFCLMKFKDFPSMKSHISKCHKN